MTTTPEIFSAIGAVSGCVSIVWLVVQAGDRLWRPKDPSGGLIESVMALAESQKQLTDQIRLIAQGVRDLTGTINATSELNAVRYDVVRRELSEVRQSLDGLRNHQP